MKIASCPKNYNKDQDKICSPKTTLHRVLKQLDEIDLSILSKLQRVDNGRLGIPVYLSICDTDARLVMPTRKQMGKGASPEQAQASALMELMERFGFFSFWHEQRNAFKGTWEQAELKFGSNLLAIKEIIKACHDVIDEETAKKILNLREWLFFPATKVIDESTVYLPLDLFKQLGEFNGSSAGNVDAESILQGSCELVERHVCDLIDQSKPTVPTIRQNDITDEVVNDLISKFTTNGITLLLKDFSHGMPVPTVAALAYDPKTFPHLSELVYTAGTATTPEKAAIRAITEVAQLAGDFCTGACYEASGLPKYASLEESAWLNKGNDISLSELPRIEADDMRDELMQFADKLSQQGFTLYSIFTTNPKTTIPSHYNIIPGFCFRERDKNSSLGLFTGKMLAEEENFTQGMEKLAVLESLQPKAHYISFFKGLLYMRAEDFSEAISCFLQAAPLQPDSDSQALVAFYTGYVLTLQSNWDEAFAYLDKAVSLCPEMKEYLNLRGVILFKKEQYEEAAKDFQTILQTLDKGSVMDIMNFGLCQKFMGHKEEAKHYLEEALRIDPTLEPAKKHLAELSS